MVEGRARAGGSVFHLFLPRFNRGSSTFVFRILLFWLLCGTLKALGIPSHDIIRLEICKEEVPLQTLEVLKKESNKAVDTA
jgi:hypothetical protein